MKRYGSLLMALCLLLCALPFAHAAKNPVPGAYFTRPVSGVNDLCKLMQEDPKVAARFTKHFGMSTGDLCAYFKDNLSLAKLQQAGRYTEYFIDVHGRMLSHIKYVNTGIPVLVTADGTPVIDMRCGNPMMKRLPKPIAKAKPKIEVKVAQQQQETPPVVAPVPIPVVTPPPPAPAPAPVEPVTQVLGQAPQEISFAPAAIASGVAALIPLLGAGAVSGHSTPPTAVPEPSSMLVLLSGITGLAAARRWRR
jgi:hypothetical protein